jgi:hypothetical protein
MKEGIIKKVRILPGPSKKLKVRKKYDTVQSYRALGTYGIYIVSVRIFRKSGHIHLTTLL